MNGPANTFYMCSAANQCGVRDNSSAHRGTKCIIAIICCPVKSSARSARRPRRKRVTQPDYDQNSAPVEEDPHRRISHCCERIVAFKGQLPKREFDSRKANKSTKIRALTQPKSTASRGRTWLLNRNVKEVAIPSMPRGLSSLIRHLGTLVPALRTLLKAALCPNRSGIVKESGFPLS
jgi:hypothetical protein